MYTRIIADSKNKLILKRSSCHFRGSSSASGCTQPPNLDSRSPCVHLGTSRLNAPPLPIFLTLGIQIVEAKRGEVILLLSQADGAGNRPGGVGWRMGRVGWLSAARTGASVAAGPGAACNAPHHLAPDRHGEGPAVPGSLPCPAACCAWQPGSFAPPPPPAARGSGSLAAIRESALDQDPDSEGEGRAYQCLLTAY